MLFHLYNFFLNHSTFFNPIPIKKKIFLIGQNTHHDEDDGDQSD